MQYLHYRFKLAKNQVTSLGTINIIVINENKLKYFLYLQFKWKIFIKNFFHFSQTTVWFWYLVHTCI